MPRKPKEGAIATTAKLREEHRWLLHELGEGDRTAGIELVARMTRLLAQAYAELNGGDSAVGQAIADEIEEINVPSIYKKAKTEPVIVRSKTGEISAWIF